MKVEMTVDRMAGALRGCEVLYALGYGHTKRGLESRFKKAVEIHGHDEVRAAIRSLVAFAQIFRDLRLTADVTDAAQPPEGSK